MRERELPRDMRMMLRTGGSGRYRAYFSAEDLRFFEEEVLAPLRAAGVPMALN